MTGRVSVTERVLAELAGVRVAAGCCRRAELVGVLRFAGQLHPMGGRVPLHLVNGAVCDMAALWRGAFLTQGGLSGPGRKAELTVTCPSAEAAMALVGAARRLGVPARSKELRGQPRVLVRDPEAINTLLSAMGVREMLTRWYQAPTRTGAAPVEAFGESNLRRAQAAAEQACAAVQDALRILGDRVPEHLAEAGALRLAHPEATLEELGQRYADPPMTKDAVAGRIRRLLQLAERTPEPTAGASTMGRLSVRARTMTSTAAGKDGAP